jgi:hypothetical protein
MILADGASFYGTKILLLDLFDEESGARRLGLSGWRRLVEL